MTVDSELIFALAEQSRGCTACALEQLVGSMATAWLDEGREELLVARGTGRPLWIGTAEQELFFASTRAALELVEEYSSLNLHKREVSEGSVLAVNDGRIVGRDSFQPDMSFEAKPRPAVRAPKEARVTLARLAALHRRPSSHTGGHWFDREPWMLDGRCRCRSPPVTTTETASEEEEPKPSDGLEPSTPSLPWRF